jgi:hypothetical protein
MTGFGAILAKLGVFLVATVIGGGGALAATGALSPKAPVSSAGLAPDFLLTAAEPPPVLAAFDLVPDPSQPPLLLEGLPPAELSLAASSLLGGEPVVPVVKPLGFPRIDPVSQFDGGPFQGANCTLAAGAMLARLGFGIVTSGSILRTLQDDQVGGTGLDDLQDALWRGYGVTVRTGLLTPAQLKGLLDAGYGAVIQGIYGKIPGPIRLQTDFVGPHAIYLDGHYKGGHGTPEAYYVIDPLGRPHSRYDGAWWPASIIDSFGTAFGGGRIPAAWVFPPGGVPPEVVGPDVVPIPPSPDEPGPGPSPSPGSSASPSPSPSGPIGPVEPGDLTPFDPVVDPVFTGDITLGGIDFDPHLLVCLLPPIPPSCPGGVEGVFEVPGGGLPPVLPGPEITIHAVDADTPGTAIVAFSLDPPGAPADVRFWQADGSPAVVYGASSMSTISLFGNTWTIARLDVRADTPYHFQVVAGDGIVAAASPVGSFTTADGVVSFEVSLAATSSPVFGLGTGFSPYLHLAPGGFAQPLLRIDGLAPAGCTGTAHFGGIDFCLSLEDAGDVPAGSCTRAQVTYQLAGIAGTGVLLRAFPTEDGMLPDGTETLAGVLEADGPLDSGDVAVGCLASGLSYSILLDVVGDDRGPLAGEVITVP